MPTPNADRLRDTWLTFFAERGHARPPAAALVPENDPTLLFTGAGMNQFKELFLGRVDPPWRRAVTVQPCFRQGDLDNVGKTPRHLTLFEMLGHFSFGDYFKKEAVAWAWEFLTKVLAVPADRLRISIYQDDDEAYQAWQAVGVARDRIARFDAKENFWPANAPADGPDGVCGPCSEVFFDYGERRAVGDGGPKAYDSGRYIEIWNSVFTQFDRRGPGNLVPLPRRNIDCGVGFERVLAMLEGQVSPFGTSLFRPILEGIAGIAGKPYPFPPSGDLPEGADPRRMRRIADHVRGACFLVAAGVKPSNEGRGYVLRRILRLAIRDGIQLGLDEPFLAGLVTPVVRVMGPGYPSLSEGQAVIAAVLSGEEERFRATYDQGLRFLEEAARGLAPGGVLAGGAAFKLHDTYGFPLDLAERILAERGIGVDRAGFEVEMTEQRERARRGSKISGAIFAGGPLSELRARGVAPTVFLGYDAPGGPGAAAEARGVRARARVVGLIEGERLVDEAPSGKDVTVVLDQTPFYAQSGGQVGDCGHLVGDEVRASVEDTQGLEGYTLHRARVLSGALRVGDALTAEIDEALRDATRRNHTATHLLHAALKQVLGEHVRQEGSLVAPGHLRFDFGHPRALAPEELQAVEDLVNAWILQNDPVTTRVLPLEEAKASGAVSLFGEKYADVVRVVGVESGSRELCGGTHCRRTGDIGSLRIVHEMSIAAGVRRIEALTGKRSAQAAADDRRVVRDLGLLLKATPEGLVARVQALQEELKTLKKAEERARRDQGLEAVERLIQGAQEHEGLRVQAASLPGVDAKALRAIWDALREGGVDVALVVGEADGKAPLLVGLSERARARGLDAKVLLQAATARLGGGGGGKPDLAQGQGQDRGQIAAAIGDVQDLVRRAVRTRA